MILEREYKAANDLATKQAAKIQRLQREIKRLRSAKGIPTGTDFYTLETYNAGKAWLIRRHYKGDGSDIVCYPANFEVAVERWLGLQVGSGVEVATLADFTAVIATARDAILEQLGGAETTAVMVK